MAKLTEEQIVTLKKYAKLKVEAKVIDKQIDDLKPEVRDTLISIHAEDNPVATEEGKLSLRPRRTWTFSDELEERMAKVKADQKLEEATGKATFTTSFDVYFK